MRAMQTAQRVLLCTTCYLSLFSPLTFTMSPGHHCTFGHRVDLPEQPALIILLEGVVGRKGLTSSVRAAGGTGAQVAAAAADAAPPGRLMEDLFIPPFVPLDSLSTLTFFRHIFMFFSGCLPAD